MKPILDALVACGRLPDDDTETVAPEVRVGVNRCRPRVEVRLAPWAPCGPGRLPAREGRGKH